MEKTATRIAGVATHESRAFYTQCLAQTDLPNPIGLPRQVVDALVDGLSTEDPVLDIEYIAQALKMSTRTLQRHLKQYDTTFASLRDQVRRHYAIKYLLEEYLTINDVYKALAFTNRASFYSWFKRWSGIAPNDLKKLHTRLQ